MCARLNDRFNNFAWRLLSYVKSVSHIINIPRLLGQYGVMSCSVRGQVLAAGTELLPRSSSGYSTQVVTVHLLPQKNIHFTLWIIPLNFRARDHLRNLYF